MFFLFRDGLEQDKLEKRSNLRLLQGEGMGAIGKVRGVFCVLYFLLLLMLNTLTHS